MLVKTAWITANMAIRATVMITKNIIMSAIATAPASGMPIHTNETDANAACILMSIDHEFSPF
jgi:hypothetical protein